MAVAMTLGMEGVAVTMGVDVSVVRHLAGVVARSSVASIGRLTVMVLLALSMATHLEGLSGDTIGVPERESMMQAS